MREQTGITAAAAAARFTSLMQAPHVHMCTCVYSSQDALDACNGWEVDRQVEQAMDALR